MRAAAIAATMALAAGAVLATSAGGRPVRGAPHCRIFPKSNQWNQRVDKLPLLHGGGAIVRSVGTSKGLHADFGAGKFDGAPIGIPFTTVSHKQHRSKVSFDFADESDKGPYPIPSNVPIEGGRQSSGDRHALIVDRDRCRLYELYSLYPPSGGHGWTAGSGAIFNLESNKVRHAGWTSADAAGLPILPGLARYEDVRHGGIDHALRFTVRRTRKAYIYPARHQASSLTAPTLPAMGQRLRLRAGFDASGFPKQARAVLTALKRYGMIVADNGSDWFITGAPSSHWNNEALSTLSRVKGAEFEVVDTSSLPRP